MSGATPPASPGPGAPASPELESLLADAAARLQPEIQRRLQGLIGSLMRAYLPQAWEFRTDRGAATLLVDRDGKTSVASGPAQSPDVTVEAPFAQLSAALHPDGRTTPAREAFRVTPHTSKGRAAFDYLRQRMGL